MGQTSLLYAVLIFSSIATGLAEKSSGNRYGGVGPDVLCVYPVDGQYTFLQRLLFYVLLTFGVLARRRKWLVIGALTTAMSYSGAAAIHAMLLVSPGRDYVDLNIYAIYSVTSTAVILSVLLLLWSTTLGRAGRRLRYIVMIWFVLVLVGSIFTMGIMYARETHSMAPACLNPEAVDTSAASILASETEACSYVCFHEGGRIFRSEDQILAWQNRISSARDITAIYFPTAIAYLVSFSVIGIVHRIQTRRKTQQRCLDLTVTALHPTPKPPGYFSFENKVQEWRSSRSETMVSTPPSFWPSKRKFWAGCEYFSFFALFGAVAANGIMSEVRIYWFPVNENPQEVGQWAPWVAVGLVIIAQIINKYSKLRWEGRNGDEERGFDRIRQNLEASMTRRGWIAPRQLMTDTGDNSDLERTETWGSKRRYSL